MPLFLIPVKAFLTAYWKYIVIALAVIASYWFVYNMGENASDRAWTKTHNTQVRKLNERIEELEKESIRAAGEGKAQLAEAKAEIEKLLAGYTPEKTCNGVSVVLSHSFVKTWNAITKEANEAKK
jgi:hypothetical protein